MNREAASVRGHSFRLAFDFAVGVVLLIAGGIVILKNLPTRPKLPGEPLSLSDAVVEGPLTARVAVIEFTDYQCPICAEFERQIKPAVRAAYIDAGRVLWAVRNVPIESKHPQAFRAAVLAECARRQGRFLPVAAALFERQQSLGEPLFSQLPRELGLDQDQLSTCIKGDAAERVRADVVLAQNLEISGTPTFLIGVMQSDHRMKTTALMKGFPPLSGFRQALDDALKPKWYSGWTAPAVAAFLGLISVAAFFRVSRRRRLQPA